MPYGRQPESLVLGAVDNLSPVEQILYILENSPLKTEQVACITNDGESRYAKNHLRCFGSAVPIVYKPPPLNSDYGDYEPDFVTHSYKKGRILILELTRVKNPNNPKYKKKWRQIQAARDMSLTEPIDFLLIHGRALKKIDTTMSVLSLVFGGKCCISAAQTMLNGL